MQGNANYQLTDTRAFLDDFYRRESTQITAHLVRCFGPSYLESIEDAVQDSLMAALCTWPHQGVPAKPVAWILTTARRKMVDQIRKDSTRENHQDEIGYYRLINNMEMEQASLPVLDSEFQDDMLRMLFACCHPGLPADQQVILALKVLCGLSNRAISRALLKTEAAVAKAYTRAKVKFKETDAMTIPSGCDLEPRLGMVMRMIYLLFNEGYNAAEGNTINRKDICDEAIRLCFVLTTNKCCNKPEVHALLSLMFFQASRLHARTGVDGELLTLDKQDRKLWDRGMIRNAWEHFYMSAIGDQFSEYHLEAGIAAQHAVAKTFDQTDWDSILSYYNQLLQIKPSPLVALHRIVVFAKVFSEAEALLEFENLKDAGLHNYYLFHAVKSHLLRLTGNIDEARECLIRAIALSNNAVETRFMQEQLEAIK